jgi:Kef-type K+ transport system membrane component KefB
MHESILLQLAIILIVAKIGGEICERFLKQPAVLGEIVFGVLAGRSVLGWLDGGSLVLGQIAEIGAVFLLFEIGLESDIDDLFKVGLAALWVAVGGVLLTFVFGYLVGYLLGLPPMQAIFVAAAMTATSIGISARVFSDLRALQTREARIVLGAAVADDVIGLIILAAITGVAITKAISVTAILKLTGLAILFLVGALFIGLRATPFLLKLAGRMKTRAAVSSMAIIFCLLLASFAETVQLAPIIGAFAAGLVLAKADAKVHFETPIRSIADLFIPVFFVMMGVRANLSSFNPTSSEGRTTLLLGLSLLLVVLVCKLVVGWTTPLRGINRWAVGVGTMPRGEVTLIVATLGKQAGVLSDGLYASILFVVLSTTVITPMLLRNVIGRMGPEGGLNPPEAQQPIAGRDINIIPCARDVPVVKPA